MRAGQARPFTDGGTKSRPSERGAGCPAEVTVEARIWEALRHVEDPEIPVSVLGMGLIVSVAYEAASRCADLQITYTAMGCPAMGFIQDDIRAALLADPDIDRVEIEVVWDPVWTKDRIRNDARETMRELGIAV
jgi:metal-sulfur cluster biosynthetic enzyme